MKATETAPVNRLESNAGKNGAALETQNPEGQKAPEIKTGDFGNGRYSALAREAYGDSKRLLGLTDKQADKFARTLAADWGRAKFDVAVRYGKTSKDGETTLREASKAKVVETRSITLARAIVALQDVKSAIGEQDSKFAGFTIRQDMVEWLNS